MAWSPSMYHDFPLDRARFVPRMCRSWNLYLGKALFTEASQSLALWMEREGSDRFVSIWEYYNMEVFFNT